MLRSICKIKHMIVFEIDFILIHQFAKINQYSEQFEAYKSQGHMVITLFSAAA